jgi:hypothetical protein
MAWERAILDRFVKEKQQVDDGGPWPAIARFSEAGTTIAALEALEGEPELPSPHGEAAYAMLVDFAEQSGCVILAPYLRRRQRWLRTVRESGWGTRRAT